MPNPWNVSRTLPEDLVELGNFYEFESGGLMLNALDLEPEMIGRSELQKEYKKLGFKREKYFYSLKKGDLLKAVIYVNKSDIGLNLSNLTNSVHIFVLDPDDLNKNILYQFISLAATKMSMDQITVLMYPVACANKLYIPYEKLYNLWVMSTQYSDPYFRYLERLLKFI